MKCLGWEMRKKINTYYYLVDPQKNYFNVTMYQCINVSMYQCINVSMYQLFNVTID
jgi:hypothetical protein